MLARCTAHLVLILPLGIPLACQRADSTTPPGPIAPAEANAAQTVAASTWPLSSMAKALLPSAGIRCVVPEGEDPAHWQPADADLEALASASWILLNGANFESYATTANLPQSRVLETGKAFHSAWIMVQGTQVHSHGAQGAHTHQGFDPHFWMDPLLALEQARAIRDGAVARGLAESSAAHQNFDALELRLRALDARWAELAKAFRGQTVLANHGTYTYPCKRHDIAVQVIDVDPESSLSSAASAAIAEAQSQGTVQWMLFEAAPNPELTRTLKDRFALAVLTLRPAEAPIPDAPDAIGVWENDLAEALQAAKR